MAETYTDQEFQQIVSKAIEGHPSREAELAEEMDVSFPTVRRWVSGANAPHPLMRHVVVNFIRKTWPE